MDLKDLISGRDPRTLSFFRVRKVSFSPTLVHTNYSGE